MIEDLALAAVVHGLELDLALRGGGQRVEIAHVGHHEGLAGAQRPAHRVRHERLVVGDREAHRDAGVLVGLCELRRASWLKVATTSPMNSGTLTARSSGSSTSCSTMVSSAAVSSG